MNTKVTLVFEHIVALVTLKLKAKMRTPIVAFQYRTFGEGFAIDEAGVRHPKLRMNLKDFECLKVSDQE